MKKFLFGCLLIVVSLAAASLYLTRDFAPTHPVLQTSDLPFLIPTRAFYADPKAEFGYVASQDGNFTASEKATLMGRSIVVRETASKKEISEFPAEMSAIRWHPTKPLLRFIFEGDDWEADPFSPERENWVRHSPVKLSGGWALNQYVTNPDMPALFWGRTNRGEPGHMWHVSQDGLNAEKVAEGNSKTQYWVFDEGAQPVLRVDFLNAATYRVFRKSGTIWKPLIDLSLDDIFEPLSKVNRDGIMFARSSRERDKAALVSFDTKTGLETVILENPGGDIGHTTALSYGGDPDIIRFGFDTLDRVALTEQGQVFLNILNDFPQPVSLGDTAPSPSGRYVTQAISPQGKSYIYLLIDLKDQTYVVLSEYHFRRFKDYLVQGKSVMFKSRDGLNIPAILTMPENVSGAIPFIVDIHGGPADNISLGYDHFVQFLVNRGYGVLSVNFRGSTGFGKAFQAKGFREFGREMQNDITDAARWLVYEGLADDGSLIAMGMSYGGYSAALAMTRDPGLFDAAIVEFPMLDVEFQSKYHPGFWDSGIDGWRRYFGSLDNQEDLKLMQKYSPSNLIDQLQGPILLLGGMRDEITAVQQVKDFEVAALDAGKNIETHYFPNAGHGVNNWRDDLRRARLIEDFLAKHVGGRSGGFEFAERAPKFID